MTLAQEVGSSLRIITASSGNHGMACALSAKRLGIPATIVVPEPTPEIKKSSIRAMGADLLEIGATYDETFAATVALALWLPQGKTLLRTLKKSCAKEA